MPGASKHSKKWDDCVTKVKKKGGAADPYAVCTSTVGQTEAGKKTCSICAGTKQAATGSAMPQLTRVQGKNGRS